MKRSVLAAMLGAAAVSATPAVAADVRVELNKLEPIENACRAYLVLEDGAGSAFESLKLLTVPAGS